MQELNTPFEQRDLVWAKIQNYPWWPGKIAQIFEQKKSLIFKISFFADPTYCYLKQEALMPFQEFRQQLNSNFSINYQLQKAIILANNAFQRKKQTLQNKKPQQQIEISIGKPAQGIESQVLQQQIEKLEEFQQSTIHIDFEVEHLNGKFNKQKKAIQIQNLLLKYKLNRIPKLQKSERMERQEQLQQEARHSETENEQQQKIELFDLKNTRKRKLIKKKNKRNHIIRKKRVHSLSYQQRKIHFMKRLCSLLISKGFDSQISRSITVKIIGKTEQLIEKIVYSENQKITIEEVNVKIMSIISDVSSTSNYDDKLLEIFHLIDAFLYRYSGSQKQEEQRTNITYANDESLEVLC